MFVAVAAFFGLLFGSFGTVVAYRVPRKESIVTGRSRCPSCERQLTAFENIPILSYAIQRGRCRGCGTRIPPRYPIIEASTAILFGLAAWKFGWSATAFVYMAFFWTLVVLTIIDLDHKLLPNRIVYPAFVAGWVGLVIAALVDASTDQLIDAAIGAAIFGGFFLIVGLIVPAGMGGGDIKLAFVLGTFLGYLGAPGMVLTGMFLSFLLGGVIGVGVMLATGGDRKMQIPFGPFLAAGTTLAVFVGRWLVDLYVDRLN